MSDVVYRVPGFLSTKSVMYIEALIIAGWRDDQIARFKVDLPRFESASIFDDFEQSLKSMPIQPDPLHHPFLKELNEHIKAVSASERYEELQRKAKTKDKDSMAANLLLNKIHPDELGADGESKSASIHFHVKEAKDEVQVTRGRDKSSDPK